MAEKGSRSCDRTGCLGFNLVEIADRHTGKFVYGRARVLGIQRVCLALQVKGQAPKEAQIVGICSLVDEKCNVGHKFKAGQWPTEGGHYLGCVLGTR